MTSFRKNLLLAAATCSFTSSIVTLLNGNLVAGALFLHVLGIWVLLYRNAQ